jgi:hypothetical protein
MTMSGGYTRLVAGEERKVETEVGHILVIVLRGKFFVQAEQQLPAGIVERVKYLCRWLLFNRRRTTTKVTIRASDKPGEVLQAKSKSPLQML